MGEYSPKYDKPFDPSKFDVQIEKTKDKNGKTCHILTIHPNFIPRHTTPIWVFGCESDVLVNRFRSAIEAGKIIVAYDVQPDPDNTVRFKPSSYFYDNVTLDAELVRLGF